MVIKIYLDASVIVPAMLSSVGGSAKLIKFIKLGLVVGITSQNVIEEIERNSVKINKSTQEIRQFIQKNLILIRKKISTGDYAEYKNIIDIKDAHVVAGARLTKCDYLVTLDKKHLLKEDIQKRFLPLKIVSPKQLLKDLIAW